jgi:hypothetical protein
MTASREINKSKSELRKASKSDLGEDPNTNERAIITNELHIPTPMLEP